MLTDEVFQSSEKDKASPVVAEGNIEIAIDEIVANDDEETLTALRFRKSSSVPAQTISRTHYLLLAKAGM